MQDFIGSDVKNWRGLFIALLVIAAILGVILLVIFFVTPGTKNKGHPIHFVGASPGLESGGNNG